MMKWRVRRDSQCSFVEPDEVRRSIEVLDEVLAQFDDGVVFPKDYERDIYSVDLCIIDGTTNKNIVEDQAPPIPTRSPNTRLSRRHANKSPNGTKIEDLSKTEQPNISMSNANQANENPLLLCGTPKTTSPPKNNRISSPRDTGHMTSFYDSSIVTGKDDWIQKEEDCPSCICQERLQQLRSKFMNVLQLLVTNEIKPLEEGPPTFVPPEPLTKVEIFSCPAKLKKISAETSNVVKTCHDLSIDDEDAALRKNGNLKRKPLHSTPVDNSSSPDHLVRTFADVSSIEETRSIDESMFQHSRLCSEEINKRLSIGDLLNLLPTDVLQRPQLGLSYSLEEDLPPGVKEIRTSTPLSTFSHSGSSSLGYVSSQSDLDLPNMPDKVPLSTFKSLTLPTGHTNHSIFYSDAESCFPNAIHGSPPISPDAAEKTKSKLFRAFSKKKKDSKYDDTSSLKSDISLDEGVVVQKIEIIGGNSLSTSLLGDSEPAVEKRKWGKWRSVKKKQLP